MDYKLKADFLTPNQAKGFLTRFGYLPDKFADYPVIASRAFNTGRGEVNEGLVINGQAVRDAIHNKKFNTGNLGTIFNSVFNPTQLVVEEFQANKQLKIALDKAIAFKTINKAMSEVFNANINKLKTSTSPLVKSEQFVREVRLNISKTLKANPQYRAGGRAFTIFNALQSDQLPDQISGPDRALFNSLKNDFVANYTAYADLHRNIATSSNVRTEPSTTFSGTTGATTSDGIPRDAQGRTPAQAEADRLRAEEDEKDRQDNIAKYREAIRRIVAERDNDYFAFQLGQDQVKQSYEATKAAINDEMAQLAFNKNISTERLAEDYQVRTAELNREYEQQQIELNTGIRGSLARSQQAFRRAGSRGSTRQAVPQAIATAGLSQFGSLRDNFETEQSNLARLTDRKAFDIEQAFLSGQAANQNALGEANVNLQNILTENEARYNLGLIDALNRQRDAVVEEDRLLTGATLEEAYDKTSGYIFDTDKLQGRANELASQRRTFTPEPTPEATDRRGYHSRVRDNFQKRRLGNRARERYQSIYY